MNVESRLSEIVAMHADRDGPLLPILHDIQAEFGCVDEAAKRFLAEALNLSRAEVHGVVSFYHDFKSKTATLPVVKLCRAEACQARGCETLAADIAEIAQGRCGIEAVYCLGLCSVGPAAMIDGKVYARLDAGRLTKLIGAL